ncbi:hypothetical protein ENUP19_0042G0011 [Entamoeba nuttalli]|uniref:Uncharacterized protein n=1 Tax=Entamoeba nuttalli TaxID=412467 RepID=A0ABQ0DAQ4_9EUKA
MHVIFMSFMMSSYSRYHNFIKSSLNTFINYQHQFNHVIEKFNIILDENNDDTTNIPE